MSPVLKEQVDSYFQKHGDFNISGKSANYLVYNGTEAINKLGYWDLIKCMDPNKGFIFSENQKINEIGILVEKDGHSSSTFACTLRILQKIAKEFIEDDYQGEICTICCSPDYNKNKTILDCGHTFHCECIKEWFKYSNVLVAKCPVCRQDTLPNYDERNHV